MDEHKDNKVWKNEVESLIETIHRKDELLNDRIFLYDALNELYEVLKIKLAVLESTQKTDPKKQKRPNDSGLHIIDGGRKFEDDPPFANPS